MDFGKAIEIALRTWYPEGHELHFNPHHPLGKLLGEWGELLDDYMKSLYKPGYVFDPEDELGDIWYYLRILCYQQRQSFFRDLAPEQINQYFIHGDNDFLFSHVIKYTATLFEVLCLSDFPLDQNDWEKPLRISYYTLLEICNQHGITLQQLTDSNWQKLKPGSERGEQWAKAR